MSQDGGILICGPGEARGELKKRLARVNMGARLLRVETEDRMTERQLAKKVRSFFAREEPHLRRRAWKNREAD